MGELMKYSLNRSGEDIKSVIIFILNRREHFSGLASEQGQLIGTDFLCGNGLRMDCFPGSNPHPLDLKPWFNVYTS